MVLVDDGTLYSWGNNKFGQLGISSTKWQYSPVEINFFKGKVRTIFINHTVKIHANYLFN